MRFVLVACLVGCRSAALPDAAPPPIDGIDAAEIPDAREAEASEPTRLLDLDGGAPRHARAVPAGILSCRRHSVWTPPAGFSAIQIGGDAVARAGGSLVGVLELSPSDDPPTVAASRYVAGPLAWDAPAMKRIDGWHAESTSRAQGTGLAVVVQTLYAGVDASGKGRTGSVVIAWIAAAPDAKTAEDLLARARSADLMLVDHACECGYDCERRR